MATISLTIVAFVFAGEAVEQSTVDLAYIDQIADDWA